MKQNLEMKHIGKIQNSSAQQKAMHIAHTLKDQNKESIASDVTGSYTGEARDESLPQQDADDL